MSVGVGLGVGLGVEVGLEVGSGVGDALAVALGVRVAVAVTLAVWVGTGDALGVGEGLADGLAVGLGLPAAGSSVIWTPLLELGLPVKLTDWLPVAPEADSCRSTHAAAGPPLNESSIVPSLAVNVCGEPTTP